ncbi:MAG: ABC transporter substrate-binding protein [Actinobacteria bacterium]|nr:ABC transporter substrate-binding protein [Actinomycetota bacterium]
MRRSWRIGALLLAVFALVAGACSANTGSSSASSSESSSGGTFLIGFPGDFSSTYAFYDEPIKEGAQFAIDQINASGGVLGNTLELQALDNRNDVAETSKLTQQLLDQGAKWLIGTTGDGILAEGSQACAANIPVSTGDGTAPTLVGDMGPCAYQLIMSDNVQGATLAEYAIKQGYKTAYVLGSTEIPYTKNLPTYFTKAFENAGGTVTGTDQFKIGAGDYSAVVTKIASADPAPDAIFTPMFVPDTQVFLRQLRQAGVTIPVLSTDGNLDPSLPDAGAKALNGFTFTASACPPGPDNPKIQQFYADYKAKYGKDPSSVIAVLGYDEIYALKSIIEAQNSTDPQAILAGLPNVSYDGVSGQIQMDPTTRRAKKSAWMVKMDGASFTCLGQPGYPTFVPSA